eukprot:9534782-Karenia_brevis.AAC.1
MRDATDKLNDLLEEDFKMYEERVDRIELDAIGKVKKVQDDLKLAVKQMLEDLEHTRQVNRDQVSCLIKEHRGNMAKCEEQLLEYSRGLTRKNKLPNDKGPNCPDPPAMEGSQGGDS